MSGSPPTPIPVSMQIAPAGSTFTNPNGVQPFTVAITTSDGVAPTAVSDNPAVAAVSALTGVSGEGATYAGEITTVSAGNANVTVSAGATVLAIYAVTVDPLTETGTASLGTYVPPSP